MITSIHASGDRLFVGDAQVSGSEPKYCREKFPYTPSARTLADEPGIRVFLPLPPGGEPNCVLC